eukprot:7678075-Pyramimonas_sp.AAC.1
MGCLRWRTRSGEAYSNIRILAVRNIRQKSFERLEFQIASCGPSRSIPNRQLRTVEINSKLPVVDRRDQLAYALDLVGPNWTDELA